LHLPVDSTTSESAPREELLDPPLTRDTDLLQENKEDLEPPNLKLETYFIPNTKPNDKVEFYEVSSDG